MPVTLEVVTLGRLRTRRDTGSLSGSRLTRRVDSAEVNPSRASQRVDRVRFKGAIGTLISAWNQTRLDRFSTERARRRRRGVPQATV
jgi:hypothetical protein